MNSLLQYCDQHKDWVRSFCISPFEVVAYTPFQESWLRHGRPAAVQFDTTFNTQGNAKIVFSSFTVKHPVLGKSIPLFFCLTASQSRETYTRIFYIFEEDAQQESARRRDDVKAGRLERSLAGPGRYWVVRVGSLQQKKEPPRTSTSGYYALYNLRCLWQEVVPHLDALWKKAKRKCRERVRVDPWQDVRWPAACRFRVRAAMGARDKFAEFPPSGVGAAGSGHAAEGRRKAGGDGRRKRAHGG